ncbi:hypothetical protein Pmani_009198 [Petrolisthes manimaculis]|uniref:Alpha-1,3-mannosyl-glycoprotein 2-beta-N-acetylglucosaminyltransferase n=1 Tax=Petrolisthes manimaculis TaxID=1843537 RepID=A0AAE1UDU1_9EUCA|nr:hypothetical protein Pmani_009198 [Petrolisthes manimaculis]
MKRISLVSVCRHVLWTGMVGFIMVGFYGVYQFLFGLPPVRVVEFYMGNASMPISFKDHGERIVSQYMEVGEILPNCGISYVCPHNHFPVHIFTGKGKDDTPKICVSGKYIIQKDINNGGRGLNLVVVDSHRMQAVHARRFDTYATDSSELELFLLREVRPGDILIALTFDEASRNLGASAKNLLAEIGSSQIQNLQFRGQWYLITQRGMKGFSPFELLKASKGGLWSPINEHFCIPRLLEGRTIMPDPLVLQNEPRAKFCDHHTDLADFCSVSQKHVPLKPAVLTNRQLVGSPMFITPIMVVGGSSLEALTLTLETVMSQPGIQPRYVVVVYNPDVLPDAPQLCKLFGFNSKPAKTKQYHEVVHAVFDTVETMFPGTVYVMMIEEGLLLAPDCLSYTAALLPLLHDPTVLAISAWNPNGFPNVSSRPDLVYRSEDFPGQAFTIRMATYFSQLRPDLRRCCNQPGWVGWLEVGRWEREVVVPDVSRVLRRPVGPDLEPTTPLISALFHRLRATNLEVSAVISNTEVLVVDRYESHLIHLLNNSHTYTLNLTHAALTNCAATASTAKLNLLMSDKQGVYVIPFKESDQSGVSGMKLLCLCFGLFHEDHTPPRGLHRGLLRFSMKGSEVIFLSNKSPHFLLPRYSRTTLTLP